MATKDDLLALEQRMATKDELQELEQRVTTRMDLMEERMATKADLDDLGRRISAELAGAVARLDESIKSRKDDENTLYRIVDDHEQRIRQLEHRTR